MHQKLAFSSRIRVFHAWKNQESELLRTKQTHEKNRSQGRIPTDRLGYSLSQIAEVKFPLTWLFPNQFSYLQAERRASDAKLEYEHVSKLVKAEVARFEQERIEDFKDSLHAFLEGMISRQKEVGILSFLYHLLLSHYLFLQLISAWENYQQMLLKRVGGGGTRAVSGPSS